MDVWQITVAALRRWYILLPLLALTAFAALRVGEGVHPQYEASATAIIVPGPVASEIESPYGNRNETTQVIAIVLGATEARDAIAAQGLNPDYSVQVASRSNVLDVNVLSDSESVSLATGDAVLERARQELVQRQDEAGIPANAQYGLQVLQPPTITDVVAEGKLRNMAVVGIVGAAFALLVAVLFDDLMGLGKRWLRRMRARRAADRTTGVVASLPDEPGETEAAAASPGASTATEPEASATAGDGPGDADSDPAELTTDAQEQETLERTGRPN